METESQGNTVFTPFFDLYLKIPLFSDLLIPYLQLISTESYIFSVIFQDKNHVNLDRVRVPTIHTEIDKEKYNWQNIDEW